MQSIIMRNHHWLCAWIGHAYQPSTQMSRDLDGLPTGYPIYLWCARCATLASGTPSFVTTIDELPG